MNTPSKARRVTVTATLVVLAILAMWHLYREFVASPWTRDAQVSAKVVMITPRINGQVLEVNVIDNQRVDKGDVLFRIDPAPYELQVSSAQAALASARQQARALAAMVTVAEAGVMTATKGIETAQGKIEAAQAQAEAAEALVAAADAGLQSAKAAITRGEAERDLKIQQRDRAAKLAKNGAGSVAHAQSTAAGVQSAEAALVSAHAGLSAAEASRLQATAGLAQAKANLIVAKTGMGTAEAQLESAKANLVKAKADLGASGEENVGVLSAKVQLRNAELNLEWTVIPAPADGYVTNLGVVAGEFATAGKPIMAFVDSSSFFVMGFFRETQLRHLKIGDPALATLMSHRDQPIEGVVESIGWAISPPNLAQTGRDGDSALVPVIQPTFDWIRLAQRVPVRIKLTRIPDGIALISGTTASVSIHPTD